ncbi:uncharacterized protein LOC116028956 [Ipomoea triloba]|uniref:uncharacterized protein LOC116028956 n=1 Tax=Ipomoea triloba TaxID=35885 RepID=UPI00125D3711|nr:uncharacterized protein LOC116028956 [Ipomoea triloba]
MSCGDEYSPDDMLCAGYNLLAYREDFITLVSGYVSTNIVQIWCQRMMIFVDFKSLTTRLIPEGVKHKDKYGESSMGNVQINYFRTNRRRLCFLEALCVPGGGVFCVGEK